MSAICQANLCPFELCIPVGPHEVGLKARQFQEVAPIDFAIKNDIISPRFATKTTRWDSNSVAELDATGILYGASIPATMIQNPDITELQHFVGLFPRALWFETEAPCMIDYHLWRALEDVPHQERMRAYVLSGEPNNPHIGPLLTSMDWVNNFRALTDTFKKVRPVIGDRPVFVENMPSTTYFESYDDKRGHIVEYDPSGSCSLSFNPSACFTLAALSAFCERTYILPIVDVPHHLSTLRHLKRQPPFDRWHEGTHQYPSSDRDCTKWENVMLEISGCYIDSHGYLTTIAGREIDPLVTPLHYVHIEPPEQTSWNQGVVPLCHKPISNREDTEEMMIHVIQYTGRKPGFRMLLEASSPFHVNEFGPLVMQNHQSLELLGEWLVHLPR